MTSATSTLDAYARLSTPFGAVVDRLSPADWQAASPCAGWSARDVLGHVLTTQREFLAQHGVEGAPQPPAENGPARAWHGHDDWMRGVLADPEVEGTAYDGVFGMTTVGSSIVTFYGFDLIVHRWDLAAAARLDESLTDDELDTIEASADGFGEHLYDDGVCSAAVDPPEDADRQTRVLARLGRRAWQPVG